MDEEALSKFKQIDMEGFNQALSLISGKWKMNILFALSKLGTMRYGEINHVCGRITHRVLSEKLKELESNGLIMRKVYPEIPPKVEYSLTKKGKTLLPILQDICNWGQDNF
ncbi:winged helix-turn-helix transcriptional regulator [Lactobacillus sp.]|uniref:winged helix-turn-helix transcriptional regulator n=1 Tax=Lactobacillus sp. TaxID=1591 RepID=UPI0019B22FCE|nr:winged helix-turn-helix transcriptional regulator [Lactobacillus sp.]MBD5429450.1 winged helix-turn-helix transcriptional regulator [Lactobacillus sp.]